MCWRYNLPRIEGLDKIWVYIGATGTAGFCPLARDLMYILTIEKPPEGAPIRLSSDGIAAVYRERLASSADRWPIIATSSSTTRRSFIDPSRTSSCPPPWYRGRVVVIGDAAHATSPHCGQGAAQAIEDGIVLTQELIGIRRSMDALRAWLERRYDRCRMIVEGSETIGRWEQDHSLPIDPDAVALPGDDGRGGSDLSMGNLSR